MTHIWQYRALRPCSTFSSSQFGLMPTGHSPMPCLDGFRPRTLAVLWWLPATHTGRALMALGHALPVLWWLPATHSWVLWWLPVMHSGRALIHGRNLSISMYATGDFPWGCWTAIQTIYIALLMRCNSRLPIEFLSLETPQHNVCFH